MGGTGSAGDWTVSRESPASCGRDNMYGHSLGSATVKPKLLCKVQSGLHHFVIDKGQLSASLELNCVNLFNMIYDEMKLIYCQVIIIANQRIAREYLISLQLNL